MKAIGIICLAAISLLVPLLLWSSLYPQSDWAAAVLIPLAIGIFIGWYAPAAALARARLQVAIRATSWLSRWMTGRLGAALAAFLFTLAAVPVLAWQALTAAPEEALGLAALPLVAGGLSLGVQAMLRPHMNPPFARSAGIAAGTWGAALMFLPVLAWLNWSFASHPGAFRGASLDQAVMLGMQALPERRGPIAEFLSVFYAWDAAKLWLAVTFGSWRGVTILFSINAALVAIIVARASAVLTDFVQHVVESPEP